MSLHTPKIGYLKFDIYILCNVFKIEIMSSLDETYEECLKRLATENTTQERVLRRLVDGENLCIVGKGGSGKTYVCQLFEKYSHKRIAFLAPTGMACVNLGDSAKTIHSLFKIGSRSLNAHYWNKVSNYVNRNIDKIREMLDDIDVFVIDECSMIISGLFDSVVKVFHCAYETPASKLFNGKQIVCMLDPLQLVPVPPKNDNRGNSRQRPLNRMDYIINNPDFKELFDKHNTVNMNKNMRNTDEEWGRLLDATRTGFKYVNDGIIRNKLLDLLNSRRYEIEVTDFEKEYPEIFKHALMTAYSKRDVEKLNERHLNELTQQGRETIVFEREEVFSAEEFKDLIKENNNPMENPKRCYEEMMKYLDKLDGYCVSLSVAVGMRVMLRSNIASRKRGLVNGSLGEIVNISTDTIYIRFDDYIDEVIPISKITFTHPDFPCIRSKAFPLIPARAITIHKLQGQTITSPLIITGVALWERNPHLLYTAISRVTKKENLYILCNSKLKASSFPVDKIMIEWYDKIRSNSHSTNT